jgi:hypothetical protein
MDFIEREPALWIAAQKKQIIVMHSSDYPGYVHYLFLSRKLRMESCEDGWIRGPSPRQSGFGPAGGSSPRMTDEA